MSAEPRFTEAEWESFKARRECAALGHSYLPIEDGIGEPVLLRCDRCGREWSVTA
jgi:hypothetical protein